MVADVHRTLMYGGIYMYPADKAKVRLLSIMIWCCFASSSFLPIWGGFAMNGGGVGS